jgi:predicted enzyme related to lactoylglutathione lyase
VSCFPLTGGYTLIDTCGGGGINGGIGKSQTGEPWSTFYVEADDLQAVLDKAESLGAKTGHRAVAARIRCAGSPVR